MVTELIQFTFDYYLLSIAIAELNKYQYKPVNVSIKGGHRWI